MQPLKSSQTQTDRRRQTQKDGNTHRHRSSNSSLDIFYDIKSDCHKSDEIYYLLNAFRLDKNIIGKLPTEAKANEGIG